jgi:hypothetical protein
MAAALDPAVTLRVAFSGEHALPVMYAHHSRHRRGYEAGMFYGPSPVLVPDSVPIELRRVERPKPRMVLVGGYSWHWSVPPMPEWAYEDALDDPLRWLELGGWSPNPDGSLVECIRRYERGGKLIAARWRLAFIRYPSDWRAQQGPPSVLRAAPRIIVGRTALDYLTGCHPGAAHAAYCTTLVRAGVLLPASRMSFAHRVKLPGTRIDMPVYVLRADLADHLPPRPANVRRGLYALGELARVHEGLRAWFAQHPPEPINLQPEWAQEPLPPSVEGSYRLAKIRKRQLAEREHQAQADQLAASGASRP